MGWTDFVWNGWTGPLRVVAVGVAAYTGLIVMLRATGKRTLSKLNAFDFVVTVALGSTLATALLSKDVPLAESLTAFALLVGLQYGVTWAAVRSAAVRRLIAAEPALVFHDGRFLAAAMRAERLTEDGIRAAMRSSGHRDPAQVGSVVLETDGSLSVTPR